MKDKYFTELEGVVSEIKALCNVAEIRGEGAASFVYASTDVRAIELSKTENGIWVEFWEANKEPPEFDKIFLDYPLAVTEIKEWFS